MNRKHCRLVLCAGSALLATFKVRTRRAAGAYSSLVAAWLDNSACELSKPGCAALVEGRQAVGIVGGGARHVGAYNLKHLAARSRDEDYQHHCDERQAHCERRVHAARHSRQPVLMGILVRTQAHGAVAIRICR
eukprot:6176987-Pleurochrysis_carterae.AAC.3